MSNALLSDRSTGLTLEARKKRFEEKSASRKHRIVICAGTGCVANGSMKVYNKLMEATQARGLNVDVVLKKEDNAELSVALSGCQGFCQMGPLMEIYTQDHAILYTKTREEDVEAIVEKTLVGGEVIERLLYTTPDGNRKIAAPEEIPFYARQHRLTLELCGKIDARSIDDYIGYDGYFMARKAVLEMTDKEICDIVLASGLRGRGGGGFPTGKKWDLTRQNVSEVKYVICNGDEGDPGAFMDRCLMEGDPHAILEGMIIAAMAVNGTHGCIYVRLEYPLAIERLIIAIETARKLGFLGKNIFGSNRDFDIEIKKGAGAFVCGEETALIASVEGHRGMPTSKPPFPAQKGLFGWPTVINNVETLATIPIILRMGAEEYAKMGTPAAKGTKTFALTGHVANTGLIEVPLGSTLREIVGEIGGGVLNDDGSLCDCNYKAVQIGGPSGGCLTQEHLDLPLDYDNLMKVGAMVGSGGLVVMNQSTCMIKIAQYFMQFTQNESCGKCVLCREGTRQMLAMLQDITEGRGTLEALELLEELAQTVRIGSLCALGKTAPNPILSTLKNFRDEYIAHIVDKKCPTGNCEKLLSYKVIAEKCKSCGVCAKKCPVTAITGEKGVPYVIDSAKCIKCGVCESSCKFAAIVRG